MMKELRIEMNFEKATLGGQDYKVKGPVPSAETVVSVIVSLCYRSAMENL